MQGEHLVVGVTADEVGDRCGELGADDTSQCTTNEIKEKAADDVLQPDHFVIKAEAEVAQPARGLQTQRLGAGARGGGDGHDRVAGVLVSTQVAKLSGSSTTTWERMPPWYGPQSSAQTIG